MPGEQPLSIRHLCKLLQVNRGWYYGKQHVEIAPSKRAEEVALRDAIETIIVDFAGYGYRRVTHALQRDGWNVNHKRVLRIMHEESLLCHINMSAKGNVYDNAKAESFFKTLKQEEVYLKQYQTFEEASANIGQFIDDVYNTKRLHSSLG